MVSMKYQETLRKIVNLCVFVLYVSQIGYEWANMTRQGVDAAMIVEGAQWLQLLKLFLMDLILQSNKFLSGISTAFMYRKPITKGKKSSEKEEHSQCEQPALRQLTKIKFNISMDNLRPFVQGREPPRTTRINAQTPDFIISKKKNHIKTEQSKPEIYSYSEVLRRQGKSPDIFRQASNQILYKIQMNGIGFDWKQIEQVKSQCGEEDEQTNKQVWNDYPNRGNHQKNQSIASTADQYSRYYPPGAYEYVMDFNYADKNRYYDPTYFIIDVDNIENDARTTLMIKNIPNKYTIQFLADEIDKEHSETYDFLYLPCDIKNNCNVGYGFINFLDTSLLKRFYFQFHNKKWGKFRSEKICNLTYARLQGLSSLIEHFQNSKVLNHKDKKYQPIIRQFSKINHLIKEQKSKSFIPV